LLGHGQSPPKAKEHQKGDERILGDGDFVAEVLEAQREKLERRYRLKAKGIDLSKLIERVAEVSGMDAEQIRNPGKEPERVRTRSMVCYLAVSELDGIMGTGMNLSLFILS
jgi:putative transposase